MSRENHEQQVEVVIKENRAARRNKKKIAKQIKLESGSMTAFYRHEEVNKGRLKSKADKQIAAKTVKIQDKSRRKSGR